MVGRLVQQQQIGVGEQRGGQRDAHPPAAGELATGRPGRSSNPSPARIAAARAGAESAPIVTQPLMDFREPMRVGRLGLRQQREAFRIALQHGVEQGLGPSGASCRTVAMRARGQAHVPAVERNFAGDGTEQGGFARAVAADEADPPARIDREIGPVQQSAAAQYE